MLCVVLNVSIILSLFFPLLSLAHGEAPLPDLARFQALCERARAAPQDFAYEAAQRVTLFAIEESLSGPLPRAARQNLKTALARKRKVEVFAMQELNCTELTLKLQQIDALDLKGYNITELSPVGALEHLRHLTLAENEIRDVSPLRFLLQLKTLDLRDNPVNEWAGLERLESLEELNLRNTALQDEPFQFVTRQTKMRKLFLEGTRVTSLFPLGGMSQLEELGAEDLALQSLVGLENKPALSSLWLSGNRIRSFHELAQSQELQNLDLRGNQGFRAEELAGLQNLRMLNLSDTALADLNFLHELLELRELYLHNNRIREWEPVLKLGKLTRLGLDSNFIESIPAFVEGTAIELLYLGNNRIKNIEALRQLRRLKILHLNANALQSRSQLQVLAGLPALEFVNAGQNPFQSGEPEGCPLPETVVCVAVTVR